MLLMHGDEKLIHKIVQREGNKRYIFLSFDQNHIIKNLRSQFLEKEIFNGENLISANV